MADYVLSAKGTYDGSDFDGGIAKSKSALGSFLDSATSIGRKAAGILGDAMIGISDGITSAIGGIGAGIAAIAVTGGINRALAIEQAQYKLTQMGLDVESIMASAQQAVKGTKFGLDAAATSATILGTSGVSAGESMTRALETAAGVATVSGGSMEDIADIMAKVAANGKLSGDHLMQFSARGINAVDALAKHLNLTQAEVRDLVTKGEIDFNTFSDAMYSTFGSAAANANATFSGAMANVSAALSRTGLAFAEPALGGLQKIFAALIPVIDSFNDALAPLAEVFAKFIGDAVPRAVEWLGQLKEEIDGLWDGGLLNLSAGAKIAAAAIGILTVGSLGGLISQIPIVGGALGGLFGALGKLATPAGTLSKVFSGMQAAIVPAISMMSGPMVAALATVAAVVAMAVAAFAHLMVTNEEFRGTIMGIVGDIGTALSPCLDAVKVVLDGLATAFASIENAVAALAPAVLNLVAAFAPLVTTVAQSLAPLISGAIASIGQLVEYLANMLTPAINAVTSYVQEIMPQVQEIITSAMTVIQAVIETVAPYVQEIFTNAMAVIQTVVETVWPVIQEVVSVALDVIQGIINVVTSAIEGDWDGVWNGIKDLFLTVWEGIVSIFETVATALSDGLIAVLDSIFALWDSVWSAIGDFFLAIWDGITSTASNAWDALSSAVSNVVNDAKTGFEDMKSAVISKVTEMWNNAKTKFKNGVTNVINEVRSLPGKIKSFFANAGTWLIGSGAALIGGFKDGIMNAIGGVKDAVSGAISSIRNLFPFSPAKEGPFSGRGWVLYSGISVMDAFAEGAESESSKAVKAYSGIAARIRETLEFDGGAIGYGHDRNIASGTYGNITIDMDGSKHGGGDVNNYYIDGSTASADALLERALGIVADRVDMNRRMGKVV